MPEFWKLSATGLWELDSSSAPESTKVPCLFNDRPGDANARTPLLSSDSRPRSLSPSKPKQNDAQYLGYGNGSVDELDLDPDEEDLYDRARALEYGDWNVSWLSSKSYRLC